MDSAKWEKIKNILSEILEVPQEKQSEFLEKLEPEICSEVEKLLPFHEKENGLIDNPILIQRGLIENEQNDNLIGKQIEKYLILERIGIGGMGAVYLAERLNTDFKQKVALKIIKRGMDSEAILKRFANERRILSTLKHPNIAQFIDGGISSDGLPFFVMEYVDGKPLNQFCIEENINLKGVLELFRFICFAVDHAHKNLIIHRDLKPSNILVTKDGIPKLLDFGIAKLLSNEAGENILTTIQGRVFTPEYASPEQILGKNVTTSTDVYSLGIILYELLSGHRPFKIKGESYEEIVKCVCETEPTKPSEAITKFKETETGNTTPKSQIPNPKTLQGDLDNIVLKAIRKESLERYSSVQQLSEDIFRFLQGLPVLARPQTLQYRFVKYVKRHKAGVLAAAMILLSLVGGISLATWQAVVARRERAKAEQRFNDVRQLANTILFDHYERIKRLPGATEARTKLVSDALIYLDKIALESSDNPGLQRDLVEAYKKLAEIQGGVVEAGNSGEADKSRENLLKALAIQENLVARSDSTTEDQRALGNLYLNISPLFENENEGAIKSEYVEKGLKIFQNLKNANPNPVQREADLARALWFWANIVRLKVNNERAIEVYKQAAEIYENLGHGTENQNKHKRSAALTYKNIGAIYFLEKDFQKALEFYQKAFIYDKENAESFPNDVQAQLDLSFTLKSLATAFEFLNDKEKSLEKFRQTIEIQEKIYNADSKNKFAETALLNSYADFAKVFSESGNFTQAYKYYQKCEKIIESKNTEQTPSEKSDLANYLMSYGTFHFNRSEVEKDKQIKLKNLKLAQEKLNEAEIIYQTLKQQKILDPAFSENLGKIGELLKRVGDEISRLTGK